MGFKTFSGGPNGALNAGGQQLKCTIMPISGHDRGTGRNFAILSVFKDFFLLAKTGCGANMGFEPHKS